MCCCLLHRFAKSAVGLDSTHLLLTALVTGSLDAGLALLVVALLVVMIATGTAF